MFQFFRRKDTAVRLFLGAILVMVCIMLVVTLIPGLTQSDMTDDPELARIAGASVLTSEVRRQVQLMARDSRLPSNMMGLYAPQVLNQMVTDRTMLHEARRLGLDVSTEELANRLRNHPMFFNNGQFIGNEQYRGLIEYRLGMTVPQFEEKFRESLLTEKLRRVVTAGISVTGLEIAREFQKRETKLRIEYVLLKTEDVKKSLTVSDAELAGFFEKNKNRYQVPERRQFQFLLIDVAKLRDTMPVEAKELERFYNENKDRYRVQDRARVSHILFKTVGKTPAETEPVRKKTEEVLKKLKAGEDFAQLAKLNSDDAATTPKGGDLGWVVRGQTVPEFEKAAFTLEPGTLSDVIQTTYGFHVLKVQERERARLKPLSEVRDAIAAEIREEKARRAAEQAAEKAENALRKNPKDLQGVAATLGVPVQDSELLKRGDGLGPFPSTPVLEEALFSSALKVDGVAPAVSVPVGMVIARLVKVSPAHQAELAEVREQVEKDYRNEKGGELVVARMKALADKARQAGDLKKVAAAEKLAVKTSEPVTRQASIPDIGSAEQLGEDAFALDVGGIGGPIAATDGQVVFRVLEKIPVSPEKMATERHRIGSEILAAKQNTYFRLFSESLRARLEREGKLTINRAAVARFTRSLEQ